MEEDLKNMLITAISKAECAVGIMNIEREDSKLLNYGDYCNLDHKKKELINQSIEKMKQALKKIVETE